MEDFLKPKIVITKEKWEQILEKAREAKKSGIKLRAFFMFSDHSHPLDIKDFLEVPVKIIKENSPSGPIFRWDIPSEEYRRYYPHKGPHYHGTILIQEKLDMTLHYAYFMGVDFKHFPAFNINLWIGDDGKEKYKAYFVFDSKLKNNNQTHGEFIEADIVKI